MNPSRIPGALAVRIYEDSENLSAGVAQRISLISAQAIRDRGRFNIALAGGNTPRRCYERMRHANIDWSNVHVYFGDERCLPAGHAWRNDRMAKATLLDSVAIPPEHIHPIPVEMGASAAAAHYTATLVDMLPFDLILLGLGEDGHTASLFPGNPATDSGEIVVPVFGAPKPPAERVSLGLGTLNSARNKIFMVAGKTKRGALERIAHGAQLTAARVIGAEWHVERDALPVELNQQQTGD